MNLTPTTLPGVMIIEPQVYGDGRGWFFESYHADRFAAAGICDTFVQDNVSYCGGPVLRGLHLQHPRAQPKIVSVFDGVVFDVAVDVRKGSPTFCRWISVELSAENKRQLFIPSGFAHGFRTLSERVLVTYKCAGYYAPDDEITIRWDDPEIGIDWPPGSPQLSAKDAAAPLLAAIDPARFPPFERPR